MPRIMVRLPDDQMHKISARAEAHSGGISEAIRESLARYFTLLERHRHALIGKFTGAELSLLCDSSNGTFWEPHALDGLTANAEDTEPEIYEKWGVDRKTLLAKLHALSYADLACMVDAIERFWQAVTHDMQVNPANILIDVTLDQSFASRNAER